MAKKSGGRPTKNTEDVIGKLIWAFLEGMNQKWACKSAGIDPSTLWDWCQADPGLTKRIEQAQSVAVHGGLIEVKKKDPKAFLAYIDRESFGEKINIEEKRVVERTIRVILGNGEARIASRVVRAESPSLSNQSVGSVSQSENP